jgi:hypothetical protein
MYVPMYIKLGSLDIWPHRKILLEHYRAEFLENYRNILRILDTTEFFIYSSKFMISTTLHLCVLFICIFLFQYIYKWYYVINIGCSFKFSVKVGVEESIVTASAV